MSTRENGKALYNFSLVIKNGMHNDSEDKKHYKTMAITCLCDDKVAIGMLSSHDKLAEELNPVVKLIVNSVPNITRFVTHSNPRIGHLKVPCRGGKKKPHKRASIKKGRGKRKKGEQ